MSYKKRVKSRKDLNKKNNQGRKFLLLIFLFSILLFLSFRISKISETDIHNKTMRIQNKIEKSTPIIKPDTLTPREQIVHFAKNFGIPESILRARRRNDIVTTQVPVNRERYDLYFTNFSLSRYLEKLDWEFISGEENTAGTSQTLTYFNNTDSLTYRFIIYYDRSGAYKQEKPKVSIIVKGFGTLKSDEMSKWLNLNTEICFSVIPDKDYSVQNMQQILKSNYETLIELPLEPANFPVSFPGRNAIFVQHSQAQIESRLDYFTDQLKGASGITTYMGSLAVTDSRVMTTILNYIKRKEMYFVDDVPINTSIAYSTAQRLLVTSYEKHITLNPRHYHNDKNNRKLMADFVRINRNPTIITLSNADDDNYELLKKLEQVIIEAGYEVVRISEL